MKNIKRIKVFVSILCTLALLISNLSPLSWNSNSVDKVQAADSIDLSELNEITWDDFDVEETYLCMDMNITTLGGNWTDAIEVGFYSHTFEGDINNALTKRTLTAGTVETLKFSLNDFLEDGVLKGFGFAIFGGPAWDAKLEDGYTPDRHTITISNVRLEGGVNKSIDMKNVTWASGTAGGFSNGEASGQPTVPENSDGVTNITGGYCYDAHKVTFGEPVTTEEATTVRFGITATSSDTANCPNVTLRFYNSEAEGSIGDELAATDKHRLFVLESGVKQNVEIEGDFLLNAEGNLAGFGISTLGSDENYTYTIVIEQIAIVKGGVVVKEYSISDAGMTWAANDNGNIGGLTGHDWSGTPSIANGVCTISNCGKYAAQKCYLTESEATIIEEETTVRFGITATSSDTANCPNVTLRFYNSEAEGSIGDELAATDKHRLFVLESGVKQNVEIEGDFLLNAEGNLAGFGISTLGSDENYTYTIVIEQIAIVKGDVVVKEYSISEAGMTWAQNDSGNIGGLLGHDWSGELSIKDGVCTISKCGKYAAQKCYLTESEATAPELTGYVLQTGETINNTVFNGDIVFQDGGVFYYGSEESGLALSLTEDGGLAISAEDYKFSNANIATTYSASDFGLDTFEDTQFNLKIAVFDMASDEKSATVGIWINNVMVGDELFTLTLNDESGWSFNNIMLFDTDLVYALNASIAEMPTINTVKNITWADFTDAEYGKLYTTSSTVTHKSLSNLNNTIFEDRVIFGVDSEIRYGGSTGDFGLHIRVNTDGTLELCSDTFTLNDISTTKFNASDFELGDSFANKELTLKISMSNVSTDLKSATLGVWINGMALDESFTTVENNYGNNATLGNNICIKHHGEGNVYIPNDVAIPTGLTDLTWEDFSIPCDVEQTTVVYGQLSGKEMDNSLFNGDITMQIGSDVRYAGAQDYTGLRIILNESGNLELGTANCWLENVKTTEFDAKWLGFESFENERFNLKIALTEFSNSSATVGIWVNNKMWGDYFTLKSEGGLGNYLALYDGTKEAHSIIEIANIKWSNFGVSYGDLYSTSKTVQYSAGDTLNYTVFEDKIVFAADSELRYGGSTGDFGLSLFQVIHLH